VNRGRFSIWVNEESMSLWYVQEKRIGKGKRYTSHAGG
jgi:hypothetical protein